MRFFEKYRLEIGEGKGSLFLRRDKVCQDGTTPIYRDVDGRLWAMSGHTHSGKVAVFSGTSLDGLAKCYPIKTDFRTGHCGHAFSGIRYPVELIPCYCKK